MAQAELGALLEELLREPPGKENEQLDHFLLLHGQQYDFSGTSACAGESFGMVFQLLVQERFLSRANWERLRPRDCQLRVLQCMRVLMRDNSHRALFAELGGVSKLVSLFGQLADEHFQGQAEFGSEMLVETLSILKRFATHESADESRLQRTLVALLSTREALVLQCVLVAMYQFVQLDRHLQAIGLLGCSETLLHILMDYGPSFKVLGAELLELLLQQHSFFQDVLLHDGVSVLLSLLHSDNPNLPAPLLKALARLAADTECAKEIRQLGGINVVISLLSSQGASSMLQPQTIMAVCSVLTALALDDEAALQIRKANGVYLLGQLLLKTPLQSPDDRVDAEPGGSEVAPLIGDVATGLLQRSSKREHRREHGDDGSASCGSHHESMAVHAFRSLRFVFSTERNRKLFRRLFPPDLYASFIDVGQYERNLESYTTLVRQLAALAPEARAKVQEALKDINMERGPAVRYVRDYAVQELLGEGAFGSVYQAKKDTGEASFAMKELPLDMFSVHAGESGKESRDSDGEQSATLLEREVQILSTLQHPNIIRYYDSFTHCDSFYIVMELVEGATLLDHLNSLSEKRQSMAESRIWQLFTQMCLALRYIHKEKHVVHRDLTPSNIMITAEGDIKLADFGLAKERTGTGSVMESVVGTVLYQCPEIIQAEAYGEKADIWSLGCILYQTAMLRPPFEGGNPLVVARKIVEGTYAPLDDSYSELMALVIPRLLCVSPEQRPDIDEVAQMISPLLVSELERVREAERELRAEVSIERDWRQRHEREASRNKEAVHRLFARHQLDAHSRTNSCVARESRETSPMSPHWRASLTREPRSPMLSISPNRIREINDPCSRILNQLHKILFISQLPPSMEGELSAQRQVSPLARR